MATLSDAARLKISLGLLNWDVFTAALETPSVINITTPEKVLVLDLIGERDVIRGYSDAFADVSTALGRRYTYSSPSTAAELAEVIARTQPEIVVLDAHGQYDRRKDELFIKIKDASASVNDFIPDIRVPPVWILSACHTSVAGAMMGCFVRKLISRGAVCVVASLNPIDAWTASMFVGRLLTEAYRPAVRNQHGSFASVFFTTQYTTALLHDPLLPLFRKAESDSTLRKTMGMVMGDFFKWVDGKELDVRRYRHEIAEFLYELLHKYGLAKQQEENAKAGLLIPETLLFTAFGAPGRVAVNEG